MKPSCSPAPAPQPCTPRPHPQLQGGVRTFPGNLGRCPHIRDRGTVVLAPGVTARHGPERGQAKGTSQPHCGAFRDAEEFTAHAGQAEINPQTIIQVEETSHQM